MNLHDTHDRERYGFLWSEVRLAVAAVALLIGGVPPIYLVAPPGLFGIARIGLLVCWVISGIAALYLLYRWHVAQHTLFGRKNMKDMIAFLVMTISGVNLGLTALLSKNIGMSIDHSRLVFTLTAIAYLAAGYHLYTRWKAHGQKLF